MNALIQFCQLLIALIKRIDLLDLPFLALAIVTQRPAFIALAALQFVGRRWSVVCLGILQWCRVGVVEPWHCKVLPGAVKYLGMDILSSGEDEEDRTTTEPAEPAAIRPDVHQLELSCFDINELIYELTKRPLDRAQILTLMARAKRADGTDWMSANKISSAVGGTNADNMQIIAAFRPKPEQPEPPRTMGPSARPQRGW